MKVFASISLSSLVIVFLCAGIATACDCLPTPSLPDEYGKSDIVITATFERLEEVSRHVEGNRIYRTYNALMTVEAVYKGNLISGEKIAIRNGSGSDCIVSFDREKPGQKYLLFFGDPRLRVRSNAVEPAPFSISVCSRSNTIEHSQDDINYLNSPSSLAVKTRLSGMVRSLDPGEPAAANILLTISGRNFTQFVRTDKAGYFEIVGLPPGEYAIICSESGWTISEYSLLPAIKRFAPDRSKFGDTIRTTVRPRKHTDLNIYLEINKPIGNGKGGDKLI